MDVVKKILFPIFIFILFTGLFLILYINNHKSYIEEEKTFFENRTNVIKNIEKRVNNEIKKEILEIKFLLNHFSDYHPNNFKTLENYRNLEHNEKFNIYVYIDNEVKFVVSELKFDLDNISEEYIKKYEQFKSIDEIQDVIIYNNYRLLPYIYKKDRETLFIIYFDLNKVLMKNIDYFIERLIEPNYYILKEDGKILYENITENKIKNNNIDYLNENIIKEIFLKEKGYLRLKNKDKKYIFWNEISHSEKDKLRLVFEVKDFEKSKDIRKYYLYNILGYVLFVIFLSFIVYTVLNIKLKYLETKYTKKIEEQKKTLELAIEGARDGLWDWNLETDRVYYSKRWKEILGYDEDEFEDKHYFWETNIYSEDLSGVKKALKNYFTGKTSYYSHEYRMKCKSGNYKWILDRGKAVFGEENIPLRMVGYITDIDDIKMTEEQFRIYYKGIENSSALIVITDTNGIINYVNKKFEIVTGYSKKEAIGSNIEILNSEKNPKEIHEDMWNNLKNKKDWEGEFINKKKDGTLYYEKNFISPILNEKSEIIYYIAIKEDVTEAKKMSEKLEYYATKDNLTGVYNRRMGMEFLKFQLNKVKTEKTYFSIIFADVNNLKEVNDKCGHTAGDELISKSAKAMSESLRKSDMVSRVGGDEFLIILPECKESNAEKIWSNIKDKLKTEKIGCCKTAIVISHGVYEIDGEKDSLNIEEIIEIADKKMYNEKIILKKECNYPKS